MNFMLKSKIPLPANLKKSKNLIRNLIPITMNQLGSTNKLFTSIMTKREILDMPAIVTPLHASLILTSLKMIPFTLRN